MNKSDPNRGEERLTKVQRSRNCQKGGLGGFGEDRRRDGLARRCRTSLEMESRHRKVGHAPEHGTQAFREEWRGRRMDGCFPTGFPPTCRSALCALKFKVSGRRRAARKSHRRQGDSMAAAAAEGSGMRIK